MNLLTGHGVSALVFWKCRSIAMGELEGWVAMVTGAGRGIGRDVG